MGNQLPLIIEQVDNTPKPGGVGKTIHLAPARCRHCQHMTRHEYNAGMKYCRKKPARNTANGLRRIKANDMACPLFEPKAK